MGVNRIPPGEVGGYTMALRQPSAKSITDGTGRGGKAIPPPGMDFMGETNLAAGTVPMDLGDVLFQIDGM